ncbi:hypothetical protein BJX99DRAFT_240812 [Aspergillus californicus]
MQRTSSGHPRKRTLQACEPCRRKKSKCSGERPECLMCSRLGQRCFYKLERFHLPPLESTVGQTLNEAPEQWQGRLGIIEKTLMDLCHAVKDGPLPSSMGTVSSPPRLEPFNIYDVGSRIISPPTAESASPSSDAGYPPIRSWSMTVKVARTFLLYCDSQPLPLFYPDTFVSTFPNRAFEVVYSVLAVASRFIDQETSEIWNESLPGVGECQRAARQLVLSSIAAGQIELSTLQTLCLLALIDLNNGDIIQCRIHATLAMTLARSAHLDREPRARDEQSREERRRCYWSIILLHHLIGESTPTPALTSSKPRFPASAASPPSAALNLEGQSVATSEIATEAHGICSIVVQLSEVWCMAQSYIRSRGGAADGSGSKPPPWHSSSKYSSTLELVMNLGDNLPPAHRYRFIHLSSVTPDELQRSRDYWAPWLLSRFLYHTTLCLLNHPILIMLQIQGNRDVSEVFLQQTTFARIHHTSWLMHFIDFLDSRRFVISDPIFGYCAAVVGTIELHQCFVETGGEGSSSKDKKRQNYLRCVSFLEGLGDRWPYMRQVVTNLHHLMETTSRHHHQSSIATRDTNSKVSVDISGFFRILDFAEFCSAASTSTPPFGPTLASPRSHSDEVPAVGSTTSLERLPRITQIGRSNNQSDSGSSPLFSSMGTETGTASGSRGHNEDMDAAQHIFPSGFPMDVDVDVDVDDGMFLQADQLFGGLYDMMTPLDMAIALGTPARGSSFFTA